MEEWECVQELTNENTFIDIKEKMGVEIPENLREIIKKYNYGIPARNAFYNQKRKDNANSKFDFLQ